MSTHLARGGRRRRVLNDEARAAASLLAASVGSTPNAAEAPRYGELACVEHHPQISDYVPRRKRTVLATLAVGAAVAAGSETLSHGAIGIADRLPGVSAEQIGGQLAVGLAGWTSAIALLAITGLGQLIYSLRRHRVDDLGGRYRVWKWIVWGGLAASANAVIGMHAILGSAAAAATGCSLSIGATASWLGPAAIVGAWIAVRLGVEIAESRSSLAMLIAAACWYVVGGVGALGWTPAALEPWGSWIAGGAAVMGHAFLLGCMMLFAKYVVLDVQGLIEHTPRTPASGATRDGDESTHAATVAAPIVKTPAPAAAASAAHRWDSAEDELDDDGAEGRYLSKSERKRLRKQQRQNRAA
jgi:hypothetical protein